MAVFLFIYFCRETIGSLWELLGFLKKKKCDFYFFSAGVVQSCCQGFSQRHNIVHALCSGAWISVEERVDWFHFHKMNNAARLQSNHLKSLFFSFFFCERLVLMGSSATGRDLDTLDSSSKSLRGKKKIFCPFFPHCQTRQKQQLSHFIYSAPTWRRRV